MELNNFKLIFFNIYLFYKIIIIININFPINIIIFSFPLQLL